MKNFLLLLILLAASVQAVQAQTCMPDTTLADTVIVSPLPFEEGVEGTGIMDTACVNSYFETVIQFQIPSSIPFGSASIPINSVELATEGAITGGPAGFDYVCNPPNCVFEKDTVGCMVYYGTAAPGAENEYELKVAVTIRAPAVGAINYTLPDGALVSGNYYLTVKPEGSENCTIISGIENQLQQVLSLSNVPNPFGDYTEIRVNAQISGNFSFEVYNLLGQQVHRRSVQLFEGPNYIPFDGSELSNGMYQYTIRNREGAVSGKMMLSRGE